MDLRTKRTTLAIKKAFFELRQTTELKKIKVTKLCEIAMINKATFYNYFESIEHLVEVLDNEYIDHLIYNLRDYSLNFNNSEFLLEICKGLEKEKSEIFIHFKERQDVLFYKLIDKIKQDYINNNMPKEEIIKTIFLASGGLVSILYFIFYESFDKELVVSTLSSIIDHFGKMSKISS